MTATSITPELLKSDAFLWDTAKQAPPSTRRVAIDAQDVQTWGKVILAASAVLRCGAQINIIASDENVGNLALALPESTFLPAYSPEEISEVVECHLRTPEITPQRSAALITTTVTYLPENCIGIIGSLPDDFDVTKSTFIEIHPALKVLSNGDIYEPERDTHHISDDVPQPFIDGGEAVLAGMCSALLARGLSAAAAAVWATHIFYLAASSVAQDTGADSIRASDLLARLPSILRYATRQTESKTATRSGLRPA